MDLPFLSWAGESECKADLKPELTKKQWIKLTSISDDKLVKKLSAYCEP